MQTGERGKSRRNSAFSTVLDSAIAWQTREHQLPDALDKIGESFVDCRRTGSGGERRNDRNQAIAREQSQICPISPAPNVPTMGRTESGPPANYFVYVWATHSRVFRLRNSSRSA